MKVVSVQSGRAVWLFETIELNPRGLDIYPIFLAVRSRYSFATPKTRDDVENAKDGVKFEHGSFKHGGTESFSVQLSIFNDGLVAETLAGTDCAEAFLEDAVNFVQKQHGLYFDPAMVGRKRYGSSLLIESHIGLSKLSASLEPIRASLSEATGRSPQASGLTFGFDPAEPSDGMGPFTIERRIGVPFSTNRFFSSAPLKTSVHISILEQFERLMALTSSGI